MQVSDDEFFATLFEVSPVGVAIADERGRYVDVNPTYCEMFGYSREELLGRSFALVLKPEEKFLEGQILEMALNQDTGAPTEWQVMARDGHVLTVRSSFKTLFRQDGSTRIITALADVSALHASIGRLQQSELRLQELNEHLETLVEARTAALGDANGELLETVDKLERARASLEEREQAYRLIIETAHDAVVSIDREGLVTGWNQAAERMFGWTAPEAMGARLSALIIPPAYREQHEAGLRRFTHTHHSSIMNRSVEVFAQGKERDGFPVELSIWAHQVRGEQMFSAFIRDATARKQAEEEILQALEKAQELAELKSRFVAMASHEFRTPLTVIQSSMDLLRDCRQQLSTGDQDRLLDDVCRSVERMKHMLEQVLVLEKGDARQIGFHPAPLAPESWCRQLLDELRRSGQGGERIRFQVQGTPGSCLVDERLLHQILTNLLSNALKYSRVDLPVSLTLTFTPGQTHFEVQDQGIGIPLADQQCLFESFFRAGNVGSIAGTGLGLAIVKKAVELHGGKLRFDSEPGVGSIFAFSLPSLPGALENGQ